MTLIYNKAFKKGEVDLHTNEEILDLVIEAKGGSINAFEVLIHENKATLYRVGVSMLKSDEDVADAIQETLISAYKNIHKLKNEHFFKTWLVRIMINECKRVLRARKKQVFIMDSKSIEVIHYEEHIENDLKVYIEQLDFKLQQVIHLKYYEDFKISEIKRILNIPESTVKTRLRKAKQQLSLLIDGGM